jgi:hypothetical protein
MCQELLVKEQRTDNFRKALNFRLVATSVAQKSGIKPDVAYKGQYIVTVSEKLRRGRRHWPCYVAEAQELRLAYMHISSVQ